MTDPISDDSLTRLDRFVAEDGIYSTIHTLTLKRLVAIARDHARLAAEAVPDGYTRMPDGKLWLLDPVEAVIGGDAEWLYRLVPVEVPDD